MSRSITRICAVFLALIFVMMLFAVYTVRGGDTVLRAHAESLPAFYLETDKTSARCGDTVALSLCIDNDSPLEITSFTGEITFNSKHFRYRDCEAQILMDDKVSVVDNLASSQSKISFVYSGSELTNSRINTGEGVVFIKFIFTVVSTYDSTGEFFAGRITDCYNDEVNLGAVDIRTARMTVSSTTGATAPTTNPGGSRSSDARLASLTVEGCELSPAFNPEFVAYSITVKSDVTSVRITASPNSPEAVVSGEGVKDLADGLNSFTVTVTAGDGTTKDYGIIIYRESLGNAGIIIEDDPAPSDDPHSTSTVPSETMPTTTGTAPSQDITTQPASPESEILKIVGIVFGEIALFFFGFLSGFFIDKNIKTKEAAAQTAPRQPKRSYDNYDGMDSKVFTPTGDTSSFDVPYAEEMYQDGTFTENTYTQNFDSQVYSAQENAQMPNMANMQYDRSMTQSFGDGQMYDDTALYQQLNQQYGAGSPYQEAQQQYAEQYGEQFGQQFGGQYGEQYGQQYGEQFGNLYDQNNF